MIKLRPYQNEAIKELKDSFTNSKRVILCLPTGAGKTVVFSEMTRLAAEKGTQTLILTDRVELFKQTIKSIGNTGVKVQELNANTSQKMFDPYAKITVAMVETIKRRDLWNFEPKLIITDEAHKGNFTKVYDLFPNAKVVGATATPLGKHLPKYFQSIVQNIDIPELIQQGFLVNCKAYQMVDDFSDLETKAGEYTESSLFKHFNDTKLYDGVIEQWRKYAENKKTIVFNVNIEHTLKMTEEFKEAGIVSECVTSKTPKEERERILKAFKDGYITVLNNCGILTTGYDEPSIECVIMNRKTKSLPLWLQCCGRGSRLYENKDYFTILDFGMNHDEHGMWNQPREWSLKEKKKKNKLGASPVKECPKCFAMHHATVKICNYCDYEFAVNKETELKKGVMKEVVPSYLLGKKLSELDLGDLIELEKSKKFKSTYIWRVLRSMGKEALEDYAKYKNYGRGWVYHQMEKINDSSYYDYVIK
jgi:superfamily II DNA or RNA helicase